MGSSRINWEAAKEIRPAAIAEFLPKCTIEVLRPYFEKMPNRENVKGVAMDCTKRYKDLVHELFPKAKVVADKYHIVRMADLAVDGIRKEVRGDIDSKRMQLRPRRTSTC